jgi:inhibitor of KinA
MGVLVEFGEVIDDIVHQRVMAFDRSINQRKPAGFRESVPAFASVMVVYDASATELAALLRELARRASEPLPPRTASQQREVAVCYEGGFAPDLAAVAAQTGLSPEQVIERHLAGRYRVYMYGFAPGYAYLGGVPPEIQVPRKPSPVRDVPAGAVLIAGPQCIVTTMSNPTGWHVIGRSPTQILREGDGSPVLFEIGDEVRFRRIDRVEFDRLAAAAKSEAGS